MKPPVVWVIDNEQWPRACLRAELIERGYDVYGFTNIDDALRFPRPDVIVLELRGQNLSDDSIARVSDLQIPTIVLGGNMELNEPAILQTNWNLVLKRPVSLGTIADAVQKIARNI